MYQDIFNPIVFKIALHDESAQDQIYWKIVIKTMISDYVKRLTADETVLIGHIKGFAHYGDTGYIRFNCTNATIGVMVESDDYTDVLPQPELLLEINAIVAGTTLEESGKILQEVWAKLLETYQSLTIVLKNASDGHTHIVHHHHEHHHHISCDCPECAHHQHE